MAVCCGGAWGVVLGFAVPGRVRDMRGRVGWGGGGARVWACVFALCSPSGPFLCLSLTPLFSLACLALCFFFWGGGWGAVRGCGCVPVSAPGSQGAGPGGADGGWLAAVVAWRLRGWLRLLVSVWVCSWRGLMGWWAVLAWLVCVGVGYVCAGGAVG